MNKNLLWVLITLICVTSFLVTYSMHKSADEPAHVKSPQQELMEAIREHDYYKVDNLIKSGVSVNDPDAYGWSPLHQAAAHGSLLIVGTLLAKNADLHALDARGRTPLFGAVRTSNSDAQRIIKLLLARNAKTNIADHEGITPLHQAVQFNKDDQIIELLLKKGANPYAKDSEGKTPLIAALFQDCERVARLVLPDAQPGSNANSLILYRGNGTGKSSFFRIPSLWASCLSRSYFQEFESVPVPGLLKQIIGGNREVIKNMLVNSTDIVCDKEGISALVYAAAQGDLDTVDELLQLQPYQADLKGLELALNGVTKIIYPIIDSTSTEYNQYSKMLMVLRDQYQLSIALQLSNSLNAPSSCFSDFPHVGGSVAETFLKSYLFLWFITNPLSK